MKFRVVEDGGKFYPQYKARFWWGVPTESDFEYDERMHTHFLSLSSAVQFINDLKPKKQQPNVVWERS
jgi:hypothetical protein